jgi:hypothetical protein
MQADYERVYCLVYSLVVLSDEEVYPVVRNTSLSDRMKRGENVRNNCFVY